MGSEQRGTGGGISAFEAHVVFRQRIGAFRHRLFEGGESGGHGGFLAGFCGGDQLDRGGGNAVLFLQFSEVGGDEIGRFVTRNSREHGPCLLGAGDARGIDRGFDGFESRFRIAPGEGFESLDGEFVGGVGGVFR